MALHMISDHVHSSSLTKHSHITRPATLDFLTFLPSIDTFKSLTLENMSWDWPKMVEAYSRTGLTVPSDKLVALSGVASVFSQALDEEYLAGLWRRNLGIQILWQVGAVSDGVRTRRSLIYRAPPWSWASVDGPVLLPYSEAPSRGIIEVVDAHLDFATDNRFESVTEVASCRCQGSVKKARVLRRSWLPLYLGVSHLSKAPSLPVLQDSRYDWTILTLRTIFCVPALGQIRGFSIGFSTRHARAAM